VPHCCDGNLRVHIVRSANSKKSSRLSQRRSQRDGGCDPVIEPDTGVSGKSPQTNDLPPPTASLKNRYSKYRFKRQSIFGSEPVLGHLWPFQRPWIYIGETGNIRGRLLEHLADDGPWSARHRPSALAFELVSSTYRRPRQQELVNEQQPVAQEKSHLMSSRDE